MSGRVRELLKSHGTPPREVYLDNENSGWVPPEVVEATLPYFNVKGYGHPSITNKPGWEALELILEFKELLSSVINGEPENVHITHSGTEANNLAILGVKRRGKVIVSDVEHYSVLLPALTLDAVRAPVDEQGFIDLDVLSQLVDSETVLVSVQAVNHEIGTIQPVKEVYEVVKDRNPDALVHVDACDALGRVELNSDYADLMTFSSHKVLGPKGAGALYTKVKLEPPLKGALSTETLWPGVENVPAVAGFKKALELYLEDDLEELRRKRDKLIKGLLSIPDTLLNGPRDRRAPDNVNVSFLRVEGEAITVELSMRGIYVSSGSACTSRLLEPSHVMLAIGRSYEEAHGSVMFKLTRYLTWEDVDYVLEQVPEAIERLRNISPL